MRLRASSPSPPADSRGAALILALLIVAAVTGLAVAFAADFQLSAARGENRWHGAQAREYLLAAEDYAGFVLDSDEDKEIDHLKEDWATGLPRTFFDGGEGWIEGALEDAQGRFNVNSLVTKKRGPSQVCKKAYTAAQLRFVRLLQTFELEDGDVSRDQAIQITNAVIDWLDEDNEVTNIEFGEGAENNYYQDLETPYRAANQLMESASELRLVKGMTAELYKLLEPYVVALPTAATDINVNTAAPRILRTINQCNEFAPLEELDAGTMKEERGETGFDSVGRFLDSTIPSQLSVQQGDMEEEGLSVKSDYFIMQANAEIGRQRRHLTTLIERKQGNGNEVGIKFLQRSDSIWCSAALKNCEPARPAEQDEAKEPSEDL